MSFEDSRFRLWCDFSLIFVYCLMVFTSFLYIYQWWSIPLFISHVFQWPKVISEGLPVVIQHAVRQHYSDWRNIKYKLDLVLLVICRIGEYWHINSFMTWKLKYFSYDKHFSGLEWIVMENIIPWKRGRGRPALRWRYDTLGLGVHTGELATSWVFCVRASICKRTTTCRTITNISFARTCEMCV